MTGLTVQPMAEPSADTTTTEPPSSKCSMVSSPLASEFTNSATSAPHRCSTCSADYETNDHVWMCPQGGLWCQNFHLSVSTRALALHTHGTLIEIMTEGCTAYLEVHSPNFERVPQHYKHLIHQQSEMGWNNFLEGRWSTEWSRLQDDHLSDVNQRSNKLDGTTWALPSPTFGPNGLHWGHPIMKTDTAMMNTAGP